MSGHLGFVKCHIRIRPRGICRGQGNAITRYCDRSSQVCVPGVVLTDCRTSLALKQPGILRLLFSQVQVLDVLAKGVTKVPEEYICKVSGPLKRRQAGAYPYDSTVRDL